MSKLQELIDRLCPDGVEFKPLGSLTIWDKRFNGVDRKMQPQVISYPYVLANVFDEIEDPSGNVRLLSTGIGGTERWTTEEKAGANLCEGEIVAIPWGGTPNVKYYKGKFVTADNRIATSSDTTVLSNKYLYYWLNNNIELIAKTYRGAGIQHPSMLDVLSIKVPIPPLEVQDEIVKILDRFSDYAAELQAELQARRLQYEYYRNLLLTFNPSAYGCGTDDAQKISVIARGGHSYEIQWKTMGEIGTVKMCKRIMKNQTSSMGEIPFYKIGTFGKEPDAYISRELFQEYKSKYSFPSKGTILISAAGTIGRCVVYDGEDAYFQDSNIVWLENDEKQVLNSYLYHFYQIVEWDTDGGTIKRLYNDRFLATPIPIPPLEVQEKIVAILDRFETLVNDLSKGLPAEIEAVKARYEYFRNKLLTFKQLSA